MSALNRFKQIWFLSFLTSQLEYLGDTSYGGEATHVNSHMNIRNLVVRKTCTPSCKEGLTPSFSQGLGCLLSQKNSGFNQAFKTRLYLNLRSYIVCQKIKEKKTRQKDGPINNLVVTAPKYNSGTKSQKSKHDILLEKAGILIKY